MHSFDVEKLALFQKVMQEESSHAKPRFESRVNIQFLMIVRPLCYGLRFLSMGGQGILWYKLILDIRVKFLESSCGGGCSWKNKRPGWGGKYPLSSFFWNHIDFPFYINPIRDFFVIFMGFSRQRNCLYRVTLFGIGLCLLEA